MSKDDQADEVARGAQTLIRGLDLLDIVSKNGPILLKDLSGRGGLTRSTTHRLASALVERNLLRVGPQGYELGFRLLELDAIARVHMSLPSVARPHLEQLARDQIDPVNLAVREGGEIRYLDQVRGTRRIQVRSVIGERRPVVATGLGRALLLDDSPELWRSAFRETPGAAHGPEAEAAWLARMEIFRRQDAAFDVEETADRVRCVAAPIRGADGRIVAALSLSSVPQYMDDARMAALIEPVRSVARAISIDLGWRAD